MSKYIDADQIRAEIERLKREANSNLFIFNEEGGINSAIWRRQKIVCERLISFLDSLPEQPVEGLEEEFNEECHRYFNSMTPEQFLNTPNKVIARHFVEWGAEHLKK